MTQERELALELGIGDQLMCISESDVLYWMQKGVVVQLHICHWRPYTSLNEIDLGISSDAVAGSYIQLGRKKLLPPAVISRLESLEMKARELLRIYSFPCPWGRFIPATTFQYWREANEEIKARFYQMRDELVTSLPDSINQLRDIYTRMATEAYKRAEYNPEAEVPREYIDNFIEQCLSCIPAPEIVSLTFQYYEVYSYIPLLEQAAAFMEEDTAAEIEMKKAVAEQMVQQRSDMISDFLAEVSGSLRGMVSEACTRVKESIERNDKLLPVSAKRLSSILEKVNNLNFYNDPQVDKMITDVRTVLIEYEASSAKDIKSVTKAINSVQQACNDQLSQIEAWRPSRYIALELGE